MYAIKNKQGQYWQAGVWIDTASAATQFENNERAFVKLGSGETWQKQESE